MSRIRFGVMAAFMAMLLTGCASSSGPVANTGSSPTPSPSSQRTSTPVSLDPCALVTAAEASALAGDSYSAGTPDTTSGGAKLCVYGSQTLNIFEVLVAQAQDAATAQAQWAEDEAKMQATLQQATSQYPGLTVSFSVSDVTITGADRAAIGTVNTSYKGQTFGATAVYLLKGPNFLTFSDLEVGHTPPTPAAMQGQAAKSLGRMP